MTEGVQHAVGRQDMTGRNDLVEKGRIDGAAGVGRLGAGARGIGRTRDDLRPEWNTGTVAGTSNQRHRLLPGIHCLH
jgi:hypothetical protein